MNATAALPATNPQTTFTFACTDCGRRAPHELDCPCGAGPLVDLAKPEFRQMVVEIEDRRVEAHEQTLLWIGVVVGIALGLFTAFGMPGVLAAIPLPVPFAPVIKALLLMIAYAVGVSRLAGRVWRAPRRFPELVAHRAQGAKLPSKLHAPRASTAIGVAAFVGLCIAVGLAVPFIKAHVAAEELAHKKAVTRRWEALAECVESERPGELRTSFYGRSAESELGELESDPFAAPKPEKKDAWYDSCRKPLGSLYEELDERSADAPLRNTLEEKMACGTGRCDASRLDKQWHVLTEAALAAGVDWHERSVKPARPYGLGEPRLGARFGSY